MASLLVLLHLLTPQPAGRKRPKKISIEDATDRVKFQMVCRDNTIPFQILWSCNIFKLMAYTEMLFIVFQSCQSLEDHLITTEGNPQPYLLATGTSKAQVSSFYIFLDRKLLPCQSCTFLGAFDELFKAHFVFSVKYDEALSCTHFCR